MASSQPPLSPLPADIIALLRTPRILAFDVASDGSFVIYSSNQSGIAQLYCQKLPPTSPAVQLTNSKVPITNCMISPKNDYVLYRQDENGNEMDHCILFGLKTPRELQITLEPVRTLGIAFSRDQNSVFRSIVLSDVCMIEQIEISTRERKTVSTSPSPYFELSVSPDGHWLSTSQLNSSHQRNVLLINLHNGQERYRWRQAWARCLRG